MRGLLRKDLELLKMNSKVLGVALLMALFYILSSATDVTFVMMYLTMMSGFMVLNTMSYDDFDNGMPWLMTLPVKRRTYVTEKYLFGIGLLGVGWIVSSILSLIVKLWKSPGSGWQDWLGSMFGSILAFGIIVAIMIPVQLKFGSENMRVILLGILLCIGGAGFLAYKIGETMGVDFAAVSQKLESLPIGAWGVILISVPVVCILISMKISVGILEKKEF